MERQQYPTKKYKIISVLAQPESHRHFSQELMCQRMRCLRLEQNLSQTALAEKIGIQQRTYSYYESGKCTVPQRIIFALAIFHDVSADYLLGLKNNRRSRIRGQQTIAGHPISLTDETAGR